jgi:hypothetical protein
VKNDAPEEIVKPENETSPGRSCADILQQIKTEEPRVLPAFERWLRERFSFAGLAKIIADETLVCATEEYLCRGCKLPDDPRPSTRNTLPRFEESIKNLAGKIYPELAAWITPRVYKVMAAELSRRGIGATRFAQCEFVLGAIGLAEDVQRVRCKLAEKTIRDYTRDQFLEPLICRPEMHQRALEWLLGLHNDFSWLSASDARISAVDSDGEDLERLVPVFFGARARKSGVLWEDGETYRKELVIGVSDISKSRIVRGDEYQARALLAESAIDMLTADSADPTQPPWWESGSDPIKRIRRDAQNAIVRRVRRDLGHHRRRKGPEIAYVEAQQGQPINGLYAAYKDLTEAPWKASALDGSALQARMEGSDQLPDETHDALMAFLRRFKTGLTPDTAVFFELQFLQNLKPAEIREKLARLGSKRLNAAERGSNRAFQRALSKAKRIREERPGLVWSVCGGPSQYTFREHLDLDGHERRDTSIFSDRTVDGSPECGYSQGSTLSPSPHWIFQHTPTSQKFPDGQPVIDPDGFLIYWHDGQTSPPEKKSRLSEQDAAANRGVLAAALSRALRDRESL